MIGRTIGRYRVLAPLGSGGMASVWRAEDTLLHRPVALKTLSAKLADSPEARARFLREARNAASLSHPGIVRTLDTGETEGVAWIAMELVDGESLADHAARGPLPLEEIARIGRDAADAIVHAHANGVVHRDISSRNLMIGRDGRVFVLDFGLALAEGQTRYTSSTTTLGTISYLAPEVAGGRGADARSDQFSLAVVLYEAAAASLPFPGERPEAQLYAIMNKAPVPLREHRPDLPEAFDAVLGRALEKEPAKRFTDAAALRDALAPFAGAAAGAAPPEPSTPAAPMPIPAPSETRIVAVLPFECAAVEAGARDELEALARGLAETIGAALSRYEAVHVVRATLATRELPDTDLRRLARQLGANLLLTGSLLRSGGRLRASVQLIGAHRLAVMHATQIECGTDEVFDLVDRIVEGVAGALDLARPPAAGGTPVRDPAARERFLQALGYLQRSDDEAALDGAIRILERLSATEVDSAEVFAALAHAYQDKRLQTSEPAWEDRAARACARARELDPESPRVLVTLGELHTAAGRHDIAIAEFDRALAIQPDWGEAHAGRAAALEAAGRFDEAEAAGRRAVALEPQYWRHRNRLGTFFYRRGRFEEARETWIEMLSLAPGSSRGYKNLGSALVALRLYEDAAAAYRKSLEVQPTAGAYRNLGSALFHLGRGAESLDAYRQAVVFSPSDPHVWGELGSALRWSPGSEPESAEPLDRAIALMQAELDRHPADASRWATLASWLANRGRGPEARDAAERATSLPSLDAESMLNVGIVYAQVGDRDGAIRWLGRAVAHGVDPGGLAGRRSLAPLENDPEFIALRGGTPHRAGADAPASPQTGGAA